MVGDMLFKPNRYDSHPWQILQQGRWWAAVACMALGIFIEWFEHQLVFTVDVIEVLGYGLLLPALIWLAMTLLARALADRADVVAMHVQQQQLIEQLAKYHDWDELTHFVVRLPGDLLPVKRTTLYSYDHRTARFQHAAEWSRVSEPAAQPAGDAIACRTCVSTRLPHFSSDLEVYCQPLVYENLLIGTLRVQFRSGASIDRDRLIFLNSIAPKIALALVLAIAQPQRVSQAQALARLDERRHLAYELHDTLAQHIGYLHLSLDRLAAETDEPQPDTRRQDLLNLREVAGEAYQQVRDQLTLMRSQQGTDLIRSLTQYTQLITRRSRIRVTLVTHGDLAKLPVGLHPHVFNLVRECLNNVQKHARAYESRVILFWAEDLLIVTVTDDGVGFRLAASRSPDHHGLAMLYERTAQLNGQLHIHSAPNRGSRLIFYLPLDQVSTEGVPSRTTQLS